MSVEISLTNIKPFCFTWLLWVFISENNIELLWAGKFISTQNGFSNLNIELYQIPILLLYLIVRKTIFQKKRCDLFLPDSVICIRNSLVSMCINVSKKLDDL